VTGLSAISNIEARISSIRSKLGATSPAATSRTSAGNVPTNTLGIGATSTTASGSWVKGSYVRPGSVWNGTTAAATAQRNAAGPTGVHFAAVAQQVNMSTSGGVDTVPASVPYASLFNQVGARYGISPKVLAGIGYVETRFDNSSVSSAGAVGMMQFLPDTAASMGVNPLDPASAIDGTARYLRSGIDRFGSLDMAIGAYNVGSGAMARLGGVVPGTQAEKYVNAVLAAAGRMS
jgi:hypothetical protein